MTWLSFSWLNIRPVVQLENMPSLLNKKKLHQCSIKIVEFDKFSSAGGIFDAKFDEPEIVFKYAVEAINNEIITKDFILKEQTHHVDYGNEFLTSQKLCRLLEVNDFPCVRHNFLLLYML
jgi:hypothetical protein